MDFFEDLLKLKQKGIALDVKWAVRGPFLYIHLPSLIDAWIEECSKTEKGKVIYVSRDQVMRLIQKLPGFLAFSISKRIDEQTYRCAVFLHKKAPKSLLDLVVSHGK